MSNTTLTPERSGRLQNKIAIVVGGGQTDGQNVGNGRATAITFAREGASVLVVDIDEDSATETCRIIGDEDGHASVFVADVTRDKDCAAFVDAARQKYGRIDVLHNNVGTHYGDNHTHLLDEASWDRLHTVNVKSTFLCCRAVLPVMFKQSNGVIINVSSTAAVESGNPLVAYSSAKAAVNGLTTSMALDCARHGVRVNAIMPGLINTPMAVDAIARHAGIDKQAFSTARDRGVPLGRKQGTGWDVANAALFLASDDARFITGVVLPVDGGEMLQRGG